MWTQASCCRAIEMSSSNGDSSGDWFMARVAAYGTLRNQHAIEAGADPSSVTLTIGVLHHPDRAIDTRSASACLRRLGSLFWS
jgi:hypothetical protein